MIKNQREITVIVTMMIITNLNKLLMIAKTLEKQKSNFSRSGILHPKTRVSLYYFVTGCRSM